MTALACYAAPEEASRHGVFCLESGDAITLYLQKPSVAEQQPSAPQPLRKDRTRYRHHESGRGAAAVLLRTFIDSAPSFRTA